MDKYSWSGDQMSWTHIRKRKITGKKVSGFPIEHRLYINVDTKYLHEMSRYFIEKCEEKGMNFEEMTQWLFILILKIYINMQIY